MKKGKRDVPVDPYVGLAWAMIDSAAFKTLSPAAVWLLVHLRRQFKQPDGYGRLILPFGHIKFKLNWSTFKKVRQELVDGGFIIIKEEASGRDRQPHIYAMSEGWKDKSQEITKNPDAGRMVWRWYGTKKISVWYPNRKKAGNISAFNSLGKKPKSRRPIKSSLIRTINEQKKRQRTGQDKRTEEKARKT